MKPIVIILLVLTLCSRSVRAGDTVGSTYEAIRNENVETVKTNLAADRSSVNFVGEKNFTLLHFAAKHNSSNGIQILIILLERGAKVDAKNHIRQTPLFSAVIYDNVEGTKVLLAHGAEVNARQDDGRSPLHWAALNGYCEVARVLINSKAAIKAKNSDGKTPLGLALEELERSTEDRDAALIKRYREMVTLLREGGANR